MRMRDNSPPSHRQKGGRRSEGEEYWTSASTLFRSNRSRHGSRARQRVRAVCFVFAMNTRGSRGGSYSQCDAEWPTFKFRIQAKRKRSKQKPQPSPGRVPHGAPGPSRPCPKRRRKTLSANALSEANPRRPTGPSKGTTGGQPPDGERSAAITPRLGAHTCPTGKALTQLLRPKPIGTRTEAFARHERMREIWHTICPCSKHE